jgi:tRNA pseudouridine55 synthase
MDKPEGPTSHDVVVEARKLLGTPQIGHTGTLDPMATGVLVLCVGQATRLARFLSHRDKTYRGSLRLGLDTDTQDRMGRPLGPPRPAPTDEGAIRGAMSALNGPQRQVPPLFSAKRIRGVRAHRLARAGVPASLEPIEVQIRRFRPLAISGAEVEFEVHCSPGTYVRSLAAELGARLGCGAHLTALRRTRSGEFGLETALALDTAQELRSAGGLLERLVPMDGLELGLPAVSAREEAVDRLANGGQLRPGDLIGPVPTGSLCRVLNRDGALLAIAEVERAPGTTRLQPRVVLRQSSGRDPEARPLPRAGVPGEKAGRV